MNRLLAVPAGCCLAAYLAAFWVFNSAESATTQGRRPLPPAFAVPEVKPWPAADSPYSSYSGTTESNLERAGSAATPVAKNTAAHLLSVAEADQVLHAIEVEYLRPYQEWRQAPHRGYSRAIPAPPPSVSFDHSFAECRPSEHQLLSTMTLTVGRRETAFPCVIDRVTGEVGVFSDGRWTSARMWVLAAPRVLR